MLPTKALEIPFGLIFTVCGCVCVCVCNWRLWRRYFYSKIQWSKRCSMKQHILCFVSVAHKKDRKGRARERETHAHCKYTKYASAEIVCLIFSFVFLFSSFWLVCICFGLFSTITLHFSVENFVITTNLYFAETNCYHFWKYIERGREINNRNNNSSSSTKLIIESCIYVILFIGIEFIVVAFFGRCVHFDRPQPHFH